MDQASLRQLDIGFPVPEVNTLALPERKVFKPIYQMGKWFARRSSAVFRALLLAAALPADPPDDFKVCVRAMLKERRRPTDPELSEEEVAAESQRLYLMAMFYRNNQENPYTKGLVVLDPFMGGGTTIVEAARLGMKPIGVDINPVAWFITKTELEPVSIPLLKQAFEKLRSRPVVLPQPVPEGVPATLEKFVKHWYTTRCPSCGNDAELIYALWVKRHRCLQLLCDSPVVRFFKSYLVTQKELRVSYIEDCICPECSTVSDIKTFDWELEPASLLFLPSLTNQISMPGLDAGTNRKIHGGGHKIRWAYARWPGPVKCPHCNNDVTPVHRLVVEDVTRQEGKENRTYRRDPIATLKGEPIVNGKVLDGSRRATKLTGKEITKVVAITVVYNPKDQALWEYRGELPVDDSARRPWHEKPKKNKAGGEVQDRPARSYVPLSDGSRLYLDEGSEQGGVYICSGSQPHVSRVFDAGTKRLRENSQPTPFDMECYAIEGYCPHCAAAAKPGMDKASDGRLFWDEVELQSEQSIDRELPTESAGSTFGGTTGEGSTLPMAAANFRFFKTPDPADLQRIERCEAVWKQTEGSLVWPKGIAVPYGYNTRVGNDLWVHGYYDWSDFFLQRQLLCLSQILTAIANLPAWMGENNGDTAIRLQEALLCAFVRAIETNNQFCRYTISGGNKVQGILSRHDFQPKSSPAEVNVWGGKQGQGSFPNCVEMFLDGIRFQRAPFDNARLRAKDEKHTETNPFIVVPLDAGSDATMSRAWRAASASDDRYLAELVERLCGGDADSDRTTAPYTKPAVPRDKSRVFPWDGLENVEVTMLKSRSDFARMQCHNGRTAGLSCGDARELRFIPDGSVDLMVTDPPFGDNVNYSELSDFFYVWLAPILKGRYFDARGKDLFDYWEDEIMPRDRAQKDGIGFTEDPELPPGFVRRRRLLQTPKLNEIIESRASQQTKTARDYNDALRAAFAEAHRKLKPSGLMAFTFHHNDVRAWWAVIAAVLECVPLEQQGFHLESVYPIVGEAETTTHHNEKQNATFDIIHVCRRRTATPTRIKWATFRRKVREAVWQKRDELLAIPAYNPEEGGYVSRQDLRMILLGVGFQLYSEHYGQVEFPEGFVVKAQAAPRGQRGKKTIAAAAEMLFEEARHDVRRETDPADDPAARNLREITYAIDEILDEIEHEQANPLPPELESLAGEVDRVSRYYFRIVSRIYGQERGWLAALRCVF